MDFVVYSDTTDVFLLSRLDGKPLLAQLAKKVAAGEETVDQLVIEKWIDRLRPREPELLLQFGGPSSLLSNATFGYPPWHLRLTQMM